MLRAVIDTNIIISALFWSGLPGQVFAAAQSERFIALLTNALIAEIEQVLARDKFAEQLSKRGLTIASIIEQYRSAALIVEPVEVPKDVVRDPKDRMVLACAVGGQADYIISGDKDLLALDR
jgi:putative PIN family toxin of toxin-antitoxin system